MGIPREPKPSILFAGVTFAKDYFKKEDLVLLLKKEFAEILLSSETFDFDLFTNYYKKEMGENLGKFYMGFKVLESECRLIERKIQSNKFEESFLNELGGRRVNCDVGYLSESRVTLATTKNFSHRIYLGKGIFAEVTLIYSNGGFIDLLWTYPDYKSQVAKNFFLRLRSEYVKMLKEGY